MGEKGRIELDDIVADDVTIAGAGDTIVITPKPEVPPTEVPPGERGEKGRELD